MIDVVLKKLNREQFKYCERLSHNISVAWCTRSLADRDRNCGRLQGFLEGLCMMGAIYPSEVSILYSFFKRYSKGEDNEN